MWEGLQQIRNEVQAKMNPSQKQEISFAVTDPQKPSKPSWRLKNISPEEKAKNEKERLKILTEATAEIAQKQERIEKSRVMYSWKNEKGIRTFSNVGFPEDGKYSEGKVEWF